MATALRNTLEFFGLVDQLENDDQYAIKEPSAQTKFISRAKNQHAQQPIQNEIFTIHPRKYSDAQLIAENFRLGIPVIMNMTQMEISEARRLIDFASGLTQALYGSIEKVTSKVFLLSPEHLIVSGDEANETGEFDNSFFTG